MLARRGGRQAALARPTRLPPPPRSSLTTGARLRDLARRPRKEVGHVSLDAQDKGGDVENGILKLE